MPPRDRTRRRVLPSQERARASVDAILDAAALLLREEGFTRMTTNRLADRAGVNVALVYRYFAGKEAIVGALIARTLAQIKLAAEASLAEHAESSLAVAVRAFVEVLATTPGAPDLHRELYEHIDVTRQRALVQTLADTLTELFARFLQQRQAALRPWRDPEALLFVLQHAVYATTHAAAFYRPDSLTLARALDALAELIVRTLTPVHDA